MGRSYHRLAWSRDGQLAFAAVERRAGGVASAVYVVTPGQPRHQLGQSADHFVIGSFAQFAQSHRFWSPDGRYLPYADRDRHLNERIWLVDTWAVRSAAPLLVDEGVIGVWSWR